ncbi:hypothetical protein ACFO6R_15985 [Eubacterium multiforme]|uniref:50S ribosomal protein L29 n=1 Tax=Eubacterium multiforme TaxID=83339 RepID=A0ABT9UTH1_9FIRM|nr:hypothetical protein [Eubacterium multiforme]MDQ0149638.1 hypothetical protein [Eubacterium multiforme]
MKNIDKENLIKELESSIENLASLKGENIRKFFKNTFDIEKINNKIEKLRIEK